MGYCRQGQDCTFAHTYEELHPASPDVPDNMAQETAAADPGDIPESQVPDMRLKKKTLGHSPAASSPSLSDL